MRSRWPARWAQKHGAFYYRPREQERHLWDGKTWFRLGATEAEAWRTWYERLQLEDRQMQTTADLLDQYATEVLPDLAPATRRQYLSAISHLRPAFGHMSPASIKPRHVYQYMRTRPAVVGNRERSVLSSVLSQGVRWGMLDENPVRGQVQRNRERPRRRYVTDAELEAFAAQASELVRAYVALKRITGIRQGQILALDASAWDGESLTVPAAKGGRDTVYAGPGLREAIEALLALRRGARVRALGPLIATRRGTRYSGDGFRSIWQRDMARFVDAGGDRFTDHDVRRKVASDAETLEHAQALLGHASPQQTESVYRVSPRLVRVLSHDDDQIK